METTADTTASSWDEERVASESKTKLPMSYSEDWWDVSMVSLSFSPSVRRTQRSRFGSEPDDSEQNSALRFLQTLLVIDGGSSLRNVRFLFSFLLPSALSLCTNETQTHQQRHLQRPTCPLDLGKLLR